MNTKTKASNIIIYTICLLAFASFATYILYINQEVFYTAHNHSEYYAGTPFLHTLLSRPFGLMQYIGAWLTQFFYTPAVGSGLLVCIWLLIFLTGKIAFRLSGNSSALMLLPVAFLLTSVVDLGYWVYTIAIRGYWFSQSVGYLLMLLLLCVARYTPRKWHAVWYFAGVILYPVLGWFALLFVLCLILTSKPSWRELAAFVVLLVTANIWHRILYSSLTFDSVVMAGFPLIKNLIDSSEHLSLPFVALGVVSLLIPLCSRYLNRWYIPLLCCVAGICFTWSCMFNDKNYIDEMRMVRYAEADQWDDVLEIYNNNEKPTNSMVMLNNVALMNRGGLLDKAFKKDAYGTPIYNPDSLHVSFLEIAAPLVYYNYGMQNEAIRLSYECAVQSGFSPFYMKMLARSTEATGETNLEKRFTHLLHQQPFYSDWQPAPVSNNVKELQKAYTDEISGVQNSLTYLVDNISLWNNSDSKVASEQVLFYSMLRCDSHRFWPALRQYIKMHQNETFPLHAQEAYIMYMDKAPEKKRMMVPVSEDIYARYKQFWQALENNLRSGVSREAIPGMMDKEFGDTYWYYNIFGRKM